MTSRPQGLLSESFGLTARIPRGLVGQVQVRGSGVGRGKPRWGFPANWRPWPGGSAPQSACPLWSEQGPRGGYQRSDFKGSVFSGSQKLTVEQDRWLESRGSRGLRKPRAGNPGLAVITRAGGGGRGKVGVFCLKHGGRGAWPGGFAPSPRFVSRVWMVQGSSLEALCLVLYLLDTG